MGCGASTQKKYKTDEAKTDPAAATPADAASAAATPVAATPADAATATPVVAASDAVTPATAQPAETAPTGAEAATEAAPTEAAPVTDPAAAPAQAAADVAADGGAEDDKKDDEESEGEEDDVMDDAELEKNMLKAQKKGARGGISAEHTEVDENWKPPEFEKSEEQEQRLRAALKKCFMFSVLEEEQLRVVIKAFQETPATEGQTVIQQGAQVTSQEPALFVIESGQLSVFKTGIENSVFTYTVPGQYFGDLALLYNAPRAATVKADVDSSLWSIDRDTFNNLVKDAARQQMQRRLEFLSKVPALTGLNDGERMSMCDAMQVREVSAGENIITQGELGSDFFIVETGKAEARKDGVTVMNYEAADFFGELALIREAPRAADVVATENCRLLVLGAEVFRRLLGSLEDILKERSEAYANIDLEKFK